MHVLDQRLVHKIDTRHWIRWTVLGIWADVELCLGKHGGAIQTLVTLSWPPHRPQTASNIFILNIQNKSPAISDRQSRYQRYIQGRCWKPATQAPFVYPYHTQECIDKWMHQNLISRQVDLYTTSITRSKILNTSRIWGISHATNRTPRENHRKPWWSQLSICLRILRRRPQCPAQRMQQ